MPDLNVIQVSTNVLEPKVLGFSQEAILKLLDGKEVTVHTLSDGFVCLQEKFTTKPGAVYLLYLGGNQNG